ncbi:regulatory protein GemA [Agrobacterium salinitolerans]|uniref:regulatory protein GemA n=1 Tax=Agrobacterium salinitolerans TaxID=1183413 RepID=UPI0022B8339F|nr:regulatory protein GemA [Agrobacterium salinitolerans]MCZ7858511.1 regulatory protein GemA [Agrobacterium salinitolerans]
MSKTIAAIKIEQKKLGLDDFTYRAKLEILTGKSSTKDMTEAERQKVLVSLRGNVARPAPVRHDGRDGKRKLSGKYLPKMRALWIACYNLGVIEDRRDSALEAFAMGRQLPDISDMRFVHKASDGASVVEALKGMLARAGVTWADRVPCEPFEKSHGYKIARAQWAILTPGGSNQFWPVVTDIVNEDVTYRNLTDAEWINVMNFLGTMIRRQKKGPTR